MRGAGRGMTVLSLREFLRDRGVAGFRAVRPGSRYAFTPEWWELFRDSAARLWDEGRGVDPRTGQVFTPGELAGLYGATPAVARLWLGLPEPALLPGSGGGAARDGRAARVPGAGGPDADAMEVDDEGHRAMEVDEDTGGDGGAEGGLSRFAPGWARSGRPFFAVPEPERVERREELTISVQEVREQLEQTRKWDAVTAWEVRNLPGGGEGLAAPEGAYAEGGAGFLVTLLVPYRPVPEGDDGVPYDDEWRSPAELAEMFRRAAGPRWQSRLRMVIAVNRFNEPKRSRAHWEDRLPYGTTARVEQELAEAVAFWQREVDAVAPGVATVIGQVVEPPVWDNGRLVDPDVLRHLTMTESFRYWRKFPFAGLRQAMVGSGAALARLRELWRLNDEVWIHVGDGDVIDTINPAGGNTLSLLERYAREIRDSAGEGPSPLVRLGGGYAFSPRELEYGPRRGPAVGEAERLGDAAKLTLVLVEADNLQRALMSEGKWPRGYFSEQNTLFNSRYLEQYFSAMGQDVAKLLKMPDLFLGTHARLGELGLLSDEHSRFLSDAAARLVTSAHGRRSVVRPQDTRGMLRPRLDEDSGLITGFEVLRPGRTLREFSIVVAKQGVKPKDRNMTFRPAQYLRVGKALGLKAEASLFDPQTRPQALTQRLSRAFAGSLAERRLTGCGRSFLTPARRRSRPRSLPPGSSGSWRTTGPSRWMTLWPGWASMAGRRCPNGTRPSSRGCPRSTPPTPSSPRR